MLNECECESIWKACVCINDAKLKIQFILILIIVWLKFNRITRKGIIGIDLLHKFIQFAVDEDFPPKMLT